jgi:signal peptidase II
MKSTMTLAQRVIWIGTTAFLCIGLDQLTKAIAKAHLTFSDALAFFGGILRLQLAHNTGAFLGLGDSLPASVRQWIFSIGVSALLVGLLVYALRSKSIDRIGAIAMALIFAGGTSNLLDRIVYGGYVVDFLYIGIGPLHTGIFNVADMAIMAGAFFLFFDAFRKDRAAKNV